MQSYSRVLIDTNALIRYLGIDLGNADDFLQLSKNAREIINGGFNGHYPIFLASISILEIWAKISSSGDNKLNFVSVMNQLYDENKLRITEISRQTLEKFEGIPLEAKIKEHDKIILATTMEYDCQMIITSDNSLLSYCNESQTLGILAIS